MSHADRDHALLSASGAHRWLSCPASAQLEQQFPDSKSEVAAEGTLAHELAEAKVRNYFFSKEFGKRKLNAAIKAAKENPLWSDEMLGYTDDYLDKVKEIAVGFDAAPHVAIEKRVDFSKYVPDGFGTADCILVSGNVLHVVDFKYGKGVPVSAEKNSQMMLYAIGAYEAYKLLYPIEVIRMSIVQPRLTDGNSDWECTLQELLDFAAYASERAHFAISPAGAQAFHPEEKACRFCRAKAQCRARAEENVKLAFFTEKKPPLISNEEVGQFLQQGRDVAKWLTDLEEYALGQCLAGIEVPGWKAVAGRATRVWIDMDKAFRILQDNGIEEAMLWERKPVSLAQIEKLIGKKSFDDCVGDLVMKNPGKPTLVVESDKREAITNRITAEEAFKED